MVEFGDWRGREVAHLSPSEKQEALRYAEEQMAKHPKMGAKVKAQLQANMDAIRASMAPKPEAEDAEVIGPARESVPMSHPDAQPPDPGHEG